MQSIKDETDEKPKKEENMNRLIEKITKFTNSRWMKILTNGFMNVAAITICGSIFSLLKSLPITAYQNFLTSSGIGDILSIPVAVCSEVSALYIAISMGYTVGKEFHARNPFATAVVGLGTFLVLTPFVSKSYSVDPNTGEYVVSVIENVLGTGVSGSLGAKGIFTAIICGMFGSRLYLYFLDKGWKIRMPAGVPENVGAMFEMMIPGGLTFMVFVLIRYLFSLTPFGDAQTMVYTLLQLPLMNVGGGIVGCLVYTTVAKLLWCFGIHGGMVAYSAMVAVIGTANAANAAAFAAGTAAPYPEWCWMMIMTDFCVLPLTLAMLMTCRSERYKALARMSLPTSLFNISEPLVFAFPIVMNPIIDIPFVLLQPVSVFLTYLMNKIGILAMPTGANIGTFFPTPIAMALANRHWTGFVWALILLVLNVAVYLPFVKVLDKKALEEESPAD